MSHSSSAPWDWHSDMQFTGKLVFSAAAVLLGTLVYRLYKSWPARSPPGGGTSPADAARETEGAGRPEPASSSPRAGLPALRARGRVSSEEGARGSPAWGNGQPEGARGACDLRAGGQADLGDRGERKGAGSPRGERQPGAVGRGKDRLLSLSDCDPEPGLAQAGEADGPVTHAQSLVSSKAAAGREDMDRSWVFPQAAGVSQDSLGLIRATSDMGLAVSQRAGDADTCYLFSSLARAQMEENLLGDEAPEERPGGAGGASAAPGLKGKIYDYYVESTSRSVCRDRLAPPAPEPQGSPLPRSFPESSPLPSPGRTHAAESAEDTWESPPSSQGASSPPGPSLSRKESFLQIAENPEFQLQLDRAGTPGSHHIPAAPASPDLNPLGASLEPKVELVAGTNFFQLPLVPGAAQNTHLDLGNCSEVLRLAKREKLPALKEAAYKVMSDNYLQVLQSPDIYGGLSGAERELILQRRLRGQKYLVVADVCPQEGSGRLCAYDNERDAWWPLAGLPPEATSRGCALCSLFNYLFVVAGCPRAGGRASNRMFCYNPLTGIWREMCPLNQARPHCKLVVLDGYMYAIGGECLYTVERYDPRQDRWAFVAPLPNDTFALAHTATACDGEIYVTGGTLRYLLLRYSGQEDRWRASPTAGGKDRTAEMAAVNGFLYRFDLNRSLGIGVYRCSARARLWYECATYRAHYPAAFQCAVVDNLIHCVGRQFHLRFLADYVSPRFLPNELQGFPSPQGTLIPTVLVLPARHVAQTRV
ncbi:kelch domain-containing protein 7A [Antechinus flavipes]|uniref:kelch domain-containing protein 7A n=1 Tax=Antechinus flavipes TaxID=38775 RepID=UPI0022368BA4|nr:kelch domain-containing protein 7A [Antechinus flavipes]